MARHPRTFTAAALAAGAVAAAGLAGCGATSSHAGAAGAQASVGGAPIARAADVSGAEKGFRVRYTLTSVSPQMGKLSATGTGSFNTSPTAGQMQLQMSLPGLAAAAPKLSSMALTMVIDPKALYVKVPSSLGSMLTFAHGKPWLSLDISALGKASGVPGLSSLLGSSNTATNPASMINQLTAADPGSVKKVGSQTVDGVATTHYRLALDAADISKALPAKARAALKSQLGELTKQLGSKQIPVNVWIDADHLVRRVSESFTEKTSQGSIPTTMQMDFLAYGPQPAPATPAASDTYNLDGLLSSFGAGAGSGSSGSSAGGMFG